MGSRNPDEDVADDSVNVLVTGFGPFGENRTNPSYLIASSLPTKHRLPNLPPIKIHTHPEPITVAYKTIRDTVPKLLFPESPTDTSTGSNASKQLNHPHGKGTHHVSKPNFDIVLHIGMAPGRKFFTLETCAHRDGYHRPDVDGETLERDSFWQQKYDAPKTLHPDFDTDDVWRRWTSALEDEDIRTSNDAGYYLCDFIYYTSLVEYWRRDRHGPRPVMFLHVPGGFEAQDVETGKRVALGLIGALVGSRDPR